MKEPAPFAPKVIGGAVVLALGLIVYIVTRPLGTGGPSGPAASSTSESSSSGQTVASTTGATAPPEGSTYGGANPNANGTPPAHSAGAPGEITSGTPVDLGAALLEAKKLDAARAALRAGDAKQALVELESYERVVRQATLRQEATLLKVEALAKAGRRADARALAYNTRDDPAFAAYRERLDAVLSDAGL